MIGVLAPVAFDLVRRYYFGQPQGTAIITFGGVLVIPYEYYLDQTSNYSGVQFKTFREGDGGRIVVGPNTELKPDFWAWIAKTKRSEEARCNVIVIHSIADNGVSSFLVHNDLSYVLFAGVPNKVVDDSVDGLCRWRSRFGSLQKS